MLLCNWNFKRTFRILMKQPEGLAKNIVFSLLLIQNWHILIICYSISSFFPDHLSLLFLPFVVFSQPLHPYLEFLSLIQHLLNQTIKGFCTFLHSLLSLTFVSLELSPETMHFPLDNVHLLNDPLLFLVWFRKLTVHGLGGFSYSFLNFLQLFNEFPEFYF